jgi:hypothetical protein
MVFVKLYHINFVVILPTFCCKHIYVGESFSFWAFYLKCISKHTIESIAQNITGMICSYVSKRPTNSMSYLHIRSTRRMRLTMEPKTIF